MANRKPIRRALVSVYDKARLLELGKVREYGTHQALIAQGGLYKTLHDLQFQELSTDATAPVLAPE